MNSPSWIACLKLARQRSYSDGRLRFVQEKRGILAITLRRDKERSALWTNGPQCGIWRKGESQGIAEEVLTQE